MPIRFLSRLGKFLLGSGFHRKVATQKFGSTGINAIFGAVVEEQPELPIGDSEDIAELIREGLDAGIDIENALPEQRIPVDRIPVNPHLNDLMDGDRFLYVTDVEVEGDDGVTTNIAVHVKDSVELSPEEIRFRASVEALRRIDLSPDRFGFPEEEPLNVDTKITVTFAEREF